MKNFLINFLDYIIKSILFTIILSLIVVGSYLIAYYTGILGILVLLWLIGGVIFYWEH